jgi:hypothetical protein
MDGVIHDCARIRAQVVSGVAPSKPGDARRDASESRPVRKGSRRRYGRPPSDLDEASKSTVIRWNADGSKEILVP